jgi:Mn2+/Fe2+ NRAMP family transporter
MEGPPPLTHEDLDRARDRLAILKAQSSRSWLRWSRVFWLLLGPGVLVFLGENDGPSMLSYAATGAQFGIGFFLPFVLLTFLVAWVVQEMTIRLGAATHHGHAELIFDRFGRFWGFFSMFDLVLGNLLTLITEFIAIRTGLSFFGISPAVAVGSAVLVVMLGALTGRYWTWERITLGLALFNALFLPVALLTHPNWSAIGHAFLTWQPLPKGGFNANTLLLLVADLGATVTPWMLFFQQSAVVDKGLQPRDIPWSRLETLLGSLLAALFGIAAIVATAPLFAHGINAQNYQAAQFAQALIPWAGHLGATLFALGIVEAGLVASITISTSSAYAFGEVLRSGHSLNRPLREAWPFYAVLFLSALLAGALVLLPGVPLVYVVLIVNVFAVLSMPPALLFLFLMVNDREIMGPYVSSPLLKVLGIAVTIFLVLMGLLYALSVFVPNL